MRKPDIPRNEQERLETLLSYEVLDTLPEKDFDDITKIAASIFNVPIALISLVDKDRQWFKSKQGINATETPRDVAFCAHVINEPDKPFIVNDAKKDDRFKQNPLVLEDPKVVFYAGIPLVASNGMALGTLCVIDNKARELNEEQITSLKALANQVVNLMDLRKQNRELLRVQNELNQRNSDLEQFTRTASHDIKSPLANIMALSDAILQTQKDNLDQQGVKYLRYISKSATKLKELVDGLLIYYSGDRLNSDDKQEVNLNQLVDNILELFTIDQNVKVIVNPDSFIFNGNEMAVEQIFINLINNAIKYNDKDNTLIEITATSTDTHYSFKVKDNGMGISEENQGKLFKLFSNLDRKDKDGNLGTGLGLATVKKLVEKLGGKIKLESVPGKHTVFIFSLKK